MQDEENPFSSGPEDVEAPASKDLSSQALNFVRDLLFLDESGQESTIRKKCLETLVFVGHGGKR